MIKLEGHETIEKQYAKKMERTKIHNNIRSVVNITSSILTILGSLFIAYVSKQPISPWAKASIAFLFFLFCFLSIFTRNDKKIDKPNIVQLSDLLSKRYFSITKPTLIITSSANDKMFRGYIYYITHKNERLECAQTPCLIYKNSTTGEKNISIAQPDENGNVNLILSDNAYYEITQNNKTSCLL